MVAVWLTVQNVVSSDRNNPEDVDMPANEHHPMQNEFHLLLGGDLNG